MSLLRTLRLVPVLTLASCGGTSPRALADLVNPVLRMGCAATDEYGLAPALCGVSLSYDGMPETCAAIDLSGTLNGVAMELATPGEVGTAPASLLTSKRTCTEPRLLLRTVTPSPTLEVTVTDGKTRWTAKATGVCAGYLRLESTPPVHVGERAELTWVGVSPLGSTRLSLNEQLVDASAPPAGLVLEPAHLSVTVPDGPERFLVVKVEDPTATAKATECQGPGSCVAACYDGRTYYPWMSSQNPQVQVLVPVAK